MVADQLRRDKDMILDNEASIKAVMENFKEENTELSEVNYQLRLRVTEILQGKWDDVANSPNSQVVERTSKRTQPTTTRTSREGWPDLRTERNSRQKNVWIEIAEIMIQRNDAISEEWRYFKSSCMRRTRSLVNSTRSMVERWRYSAICAPSTSRDSFHSSTLWHEIDLRIAEGSCIDDISEQHDEHEPDGRFYANPSYEPSRGD